MMRRETVTVAETARRELIRMALDCAILSLYHDWHHIAPVLTSIVRNVRATRLTGTIIHLLVPRLLSITGFPALIYGNYAMLSIN